MAGIYQRTPTQRSFGSARAGRQFFEKERLFLIVTGFA
jgi:hypothetical protein